MKTMHEQNTGKLVVRNIKVHKITLVMMWLQHKGSISYFHNLTL